MEGFTIVRRYAPGQNLIEQVCAYCNFPSRSLADQKCTLCGKEFKCSSEEGCGPDIEGKPVCGNCAVDHQLLRKPSEQQHKDLQRSLV